MSSGNQIKFGVNYQVDKASIQKVKQSLRQLQNLDLGKGFKGTQNELLQIQQTAKKVEVALQQAFNAKLNTVNLDKFNTVLNQSKINLNNVYETFSKAGAVGKNAFGQMASQIMSTNTQLTQTKTLLNTMGQTMMNTVKWGIASSIMNTFTQTVRQSVEYVKNLDSALTDIRIVTGDSTQKMKEFAEQANKAAQSLGRSTMDYSKAALTFYQQGLSDQDVQARTEATLKAQNITGAGDEMADYLTAVWNGYKVANEEAELYVDKLAAVADSSASNMAQLATAMSKVASSANMLGVPVDKLNAQIATITATTRQAPQTVGNALKTIYSRINDIATGADGAQISLGNYSSKMQEVGFSVLDASGHLRDTGDVLDEIGEKWNTLSREQQIYLARTMAGQRQYNNLLALFENWGRYTDLVTVSMNSQGATMEKNERYLDSLAAKTEQFGAAQERVKSALINENDLKGIVEFGTKATNVFASLIEGIGGGGNAMLALGSIVTSVFGNVIGREIGNTINKHRELKASIESMAQAYRNTQQMALKTTGAQADSAAYKQYVQNMQNMQRVWSAMSVEQIKAQEQRYNDIRQQQQLAEGYRKTTEEAEKLVQTISGGKASLANNTGLYTIKEQLDQLDSDLQEAKQHFDILRQSASMDPSDANDFLNSLIQKLTQISEKTQIPLPDNFNQLATAAKTDMDALGELESWLNRISSIRITPTQFRQFTQAQRDATNQAEKLSAAAEKAQKNAETVFNTQSVIKFASGIGQIASSINTVVNLTKTWKDENISAGQKILKTFTSVGFMIPMVTSGIQNIVKSLGVVNTKLLLNDTQRRKNLITQKLSENTEERAVLLQEFYDEGLSEQLVERERIVIAQREQLITTQEQIAQEEVKLGIIKAENTARLASMASMAATAAVIGVAIAAVIYSVKQAIDGWNAAKKAAEEAAQKVKATNEIYQESKQRLSDLKSSLDSLKDAQNNLNELTTGTEQWKSALQDVNNQVIELLDKFPQLAQYVSMNGNGMLQISQEGQDILLQQQKRAVQANAMTKIAAQRSSDQATARSKITDASRDWLGTNVDSSILTNVISAVQESGDKIFSNTEQLENLTGENQKLIDKIVSHQDKIIELANELSKNTQQTDALTQAIVQGTILDPDQIADSFNPEAFAAIVSQQYTKRASNFDYQGYGITRAEQRNPQEMTYGQWIAKGFGDTSTLEGILSGDKQKLVEIYKEINADIADQISFDGDNLVTIARQNEQDLVLTIEDIINAIAADDANKQLEDIYTQKRQAMNNLLNTYGQQTANIMLGIATNTLAAGQVSLSQLNNITYEQIEAIADATGKQVSQIASIFDKARASTQNSLKNYFESIPPHIAQALEKLGGGTSVDAKLSEAAQKSLGSILEKAFDNGEFKELSDIFNRLGDDIDKGALANVLNSITDEVDFNTLETALQSVGISADELGQGNLKKLALIMNDINNIQLDTRDAAGTIIGGIEDFAQKYIKNPNATISSKQFEETLQPGAQKFFGVDLNDYFQKNSRGAYELKGSLDTLYQTIESSNLNTLGDSIHQINQQITDLEMARAKGSSMQGSLDDVIAESTIGNEEKDIFNNQSLEYLMYALRGIGEQSDYIKNAFEDINNKGYTSKTNAEQIQKLAIEHRSEIENIQQKYEDLTQQQKNYLNNLQQENQKMEEFRQTLREASLDEDVNADKWKDYTNQVQKLGSAIKGVSNDVKKFRRNAQDVAEQILRFASAAQQVEKSFDDWNEVLNDSNASVNDLVDTLMELQNAYKDVLGFHQSTTLGEDFLKDAQNLNLMKQAIEGVDGAYQELQLRAGASALSQIVPELNYDQAYAQLQQGMANLQALADASDLKIEAGAQIHDEAFIAGLENLINGLIAVGDTADQIAAKANSVLDAYGIDAQVQPIISQTQDTQQQVGWNVEASSTPVTGTYHQIVDEKKGTKKPVTYTDYIPTVKYTPVYETATTVKDVSAASVKLSNAHFKAGGATKIGSPKKVSSGGGGGGGSKPKSSSTPKKADVSGQKKTSVQIQRIANPYEQVEKSYDRQEKKLKKLTDLQDNLSGADRLSNLNAQNKALEKQNKIIDDRRKISKDSKQEGTTAYYKNKLKRSFGKEAFDKNGQVNQTYIRNEAADRYEKEDAEAVKDYNKKLKQYQDWWKGLSDAQAATDANKKKKQQYEKELKRLDKLAKKDQEKAKERYQTRIKWLEQYQDRLKQDEEFYERYLDNIRKIIENNIAKSKIKVDLAIDFGEFEREFLDFRNKVIRKINEDDILANSKAIRDEINSYYDSKELEKTASQIEKLSSKIADIQSGKYKGTYGLSAKEFKKYDINSEDFKNLQREYLDQAKQDLQNYVKQYMDSLEDIQKLRDDVYDNYLDSIDDIQDKMDQVIDQYQRINDLVNYRIKLTQLLYGDNAGANIVDIYYQKQEQNNIKQMQALKQQADYWKARMNEAIIGSDAWKEYKKNYEDAIDSIYDALENQLDVIAEKFQNKVKIALQNITNNLTKDFGNDYLEQEWDYISKNDSGFLDTVNKRFGIEQIKNLYAKAIDEVSGTTNAQQKLNNMMQKQLDLLEKKENLTQYDIDRAKAALEVEKARLALEESRDQKTKMRLRRDSQGNYTYQFVQNEDKLSDLQSALADAQKELYNMDKQHYQSQLNQMYDVYKDYIQKMSELESEYASTRDQAEQQRIQRQMDLLRQKYTEYFNDVNDDLLHTLSQYLTESYGDAMNVNLNELTPEQAIKYLKTNLPYVNSQMQNLSENIQNQGGIAKATEKYYSQLVGAANEAAKAQKQALNVVNMSQQDLVEGNNTDTINNVERYIDYYEDLENSTKDVRLEMEKLVDQIDSFLNKDFTNNGFVEMLQTAYETIQDINNLNGKNGATIDTDILSYEVPEKTRTSLKQQLQTDFNDNLSKYNTIQTWANSLVNINKDKIDSMTAQIAKVWLDKLSKYKQDMDITLAALDSIQKEALQQSVEINATFPNVESSRQIEVAIQSLVARASQQVSKSTQ